MSLFTYIYGDGRIVNNDSLPVNDTGIVELVFNRDSMRFSVDKIRPHQSHPIHEAAMLALPPALHILRTNGCKLRTWPTLPTTIVECYFSSNHYLGLPDLSMFRNLIVLELNDNSIESIVNPLPPFLARLNLDCNALRSFNKMLVPRTCRNITTKDNPYNPYPYRIVRQPIEPDELPQTNVYKNNQSVHDSGIQNSTKANILYLVNYRKELPDNDHLWDDIDYTYSSFPEIVKLPGSILSKYGMNPYVMHGVTFTHLVDRIWLRIQDTPDAEKKKELLKRFKEEVYDGESHCTNGMMVRLSNVFLGFDDNINIKLNANEILSARIPATLERLYKSMGDAAGVVGRETSAYWIAAYKETIQDLKELEVGISSDSSNFNTDKWEPWLSPLIEPVLDELYEKQEWNAKVLNTIEDTELIKHITSTGLNGYYFELKYIRNKN